MAEFLHGRVILSFTDSGIWHVDQHDAERPAAGHRVQSNAGAHLLRHGGKTHVGERKDKWAPSKQSSCDHIWLSKHFAKICSSLFEHRLQITHWSSLKPKTNTKNVLVFKKRIFSKLIIYYIYMYSFYIVICAQKVKLSMKNTTSFAHVCVYVKNVLILVCLKA